ncbi:FAD-dependent oxidoreductase [Roseomonas haemaphysalidis]|uniref:FAD-dependent monooxygenase n=1 Tax=Roseomonas haemaphysalidis TaxID=2768162 RepID=A0ABS3KKK3_9PROT|nr:FAD-dependent oxidoreductase [Roseomonas haemaphysalidis]MBO1077998.1 FAD-dependent monooxygenase [Roseomonas haemaphysalidis]
MSGARRWDVAVVGAGPVGLTLALLLVRAGLRVQVLEAGPDIAEELRASTFHPPTLDFLDRLGLAAPLVAQGLVTPTWQIRMHETGERAEFDLSVLRDDTAHPYRLQAEQHKLSRLLLAALPAGTVRFGTAVEEVVQQEDCVSLRLADGSATEAAWVVGCDGARSVVRRAMGLGFSGETYPETTILATTTFPFEEALPGLSNVNYIWTSHPAFSGTFSLLKVPGKWRASLHTAPDESVEDALQPEAIRRKLRAIHGRDEDAEVLDLRPYRIHQRIVDDYRAGRLLLAGDAAHLNSPSGGMGMNGGIHDAFELADTLAQVHRGAAEPALLDRYTRRRRPVAEREILAQADRNRARMRERDNDRRRELLDGMRRTAGDPAAAREHLLRSSMISGLRAAARVE